MGLHRGFGTPAAAQFPLTIRRSVPTNYACYRAGSFARSLIFSVKRFFDRSRSLASTLFVAILLALVITPAAHAQQGTLRIRSIDVQYTGPETISRERILAQ